MSATGRGAERREADFYPTPAWCVERLLAHVHLPGGVWLEPSAGDGAIIRAANAIRTDVEWVAVELREECARALAAIERTEDWAGEDFLKYEPLLPTEQHYAVCLGNPPFSLAQEFVEVALTQADEVVFLLRLSFLESKRRQEFFERVGTPDVFVLPKRPSFTGKGTDACAYAWMRWKRDRSQAGLIRILYEGSARTNPGREFDLSDACPISKGAT